MKEREAKREGPGHTGRQEGRQEKQAGIREKYQNLSDRRRLLLSSLFGRATQPSWGTSAMEGGRDRDSSQGHLPAGEETTWGKRKERVEWGLASRKTDKSE